MIIQIKLLLLCVFLHKAVSTKHLHPDVGLNAKQMIKKYGYPLEVHSIQTEDGYILETHRIPYGKHNSTTKLRHSILLMPGVLCSSADFLTLGPGLSLGFVLADEGYDVWLANYRGSTWSKKHTVLDPVLNEKEFFDFSFQEIGIYDTTANIDYILNVTNNQKLFYIGHSQGTTSFFAMAAAKPEYNKKINLMIGLAPFTYVIHSQQVLLPFFKKYYQELQEFAERNKIYEFSSHSPLITILGQIFCNDDAITQPLCEALLHFIGGYSTNLNQTVIPVITSNTPAGGSMRMFFHLTQLAISEKFQMYDFGEKENMERYGQVTPPIFNLGNIDAPVALYYADKDPLVNQKDVELLAQQLVNVVKLQEIKGYNHIDYLWAKNIDTGLYNDVVQTIKNYSI